MTASDRDGWMRRPARGAGPAALAGAAGAVGLLLAQDPAATLAWLALLAPASGAWAAAGPLRYAAAAPALWALILGGTAPAPPRPLAAALAVAALFSLGLALGSLARSPWVAGARLALAGVVLALLPVAGEALIGSPFPPELAARALDLSPTSFVLESAGLDWMRHPALYDAADTASIGPDLRTPYSGSLAASAALVVGCVVVASLRARRRAAGTLPPE